MSVNRSRDMVSELHQGIVDNTYIQLAPNRGGQHPVEAEKMGWPTYARAEQGAVNPFSEHPNFLSGYDEITTSGTPTTRSRY